MMRSLSSRKLSAPTTKRRLISIAAYVTFAASLSGCGGTLPVCQIESPPQQNLPSVSTLQPAQPYSASWQSEVDAWLKAVQESRAKLMATLLMSGSSSKPGQ